MDLCRDFLTVGEDGFAAGGGEGADGAEGAEAAGAAWGVGEQEDAVGAGPEAVEGGVVVEDGGASGQKLPNQGPLTRPLTKWTGWRV